MELVRAPSLQALVRRHGRCPPPAAAIGLGVVDALAAAHAVGVLHRDVKPANVLVMARRSTTAGREAGRLRRGGPAGRVGPDGAGAWSWARPRTWRPSRLGPPRSGPRPTCGRWVPCSTSRSRACRPSRGIGAGHRLGGGARDAAAQPPGALTPVIDALLVKDPARRPPCRPCGRPWRRSPNPGRPRHHWTTRLTAAVGWAGEDTVGVTAALSLPGEGTGRLLAIERTRPQRRRRRWRWPRPRRRRSSAAWPASSSGWVPILPGPVRPRPRRLNPSTPRRPPGPRPPGPCSQRAAARRHRAGVRRSGGGDVDPGDAGPGGGGELPADARRSTRPPARPPPRRRPRCRTGRARPPTHPTRLPPRPPPPRRRPTTGPTTPTTGQPAV